jgi:hypothetical protein
MQSMAGSPDVQIYPNAVAAAAAARMLAGNQSVSFSGPSGSLAWQGPQQQPQQPQQQQAPALQQRLQQPQQPQQQQAPALQQRLQQQRQQQQAQAQAEAASAAAVEANNLRNRRFSFRDTLRDVGSWILGVNSQQLRQQQQQQQQQQQAHERVPRVSMDAPQNNMLLPGMDLEIPEYTHVSAEGFAGAAGPLRSGSGGGSSLQAALLMEQSSCSAPSNVVVSSQLSPGPAERAGYSPQLPPLGRGPVDASGCNMTLPISPIEAAHIMQHIQPLMDATGSFVSVSFSGGAPVLTLNGEPAAVMSALQYIQTLREQCRE